MTNFENQLRKLINETSTESASNTPDFILAQYLSAGLLAFETAVQQRETWYGRDSRPSLPKGVGPDLLVPKEVER